jgi:hypothetical protein
VRIRRWYFAILTTPTHLSSVTHGSVRSLVYRHT